jgi:hypothetical protein
MEKRSRRRTRDLVTQAASQGLSENEIGCARISMMARSTNAPCKGRIQMRKTNPLHYPNSACTARPVHTNGSEGDIGGRLGGVCFTPKNGHPANTRHARFVPEPDFSAGCHARPALLAPGGENLLKEHSFWVRPQVAHRGAPHRAEPEGRALYTQSR